MFANFSKKNLNHVHVINRKNRIRSLSVMYKTGALYNRPVIFNDVGWTLNDLHINFKFKVAVSTESRLDMSLSEKCVSYYSSGMEESLPWELLRPHEPLASRRDFYDTTESSGKPSTWFSLEDS